MRIVHSHGQHAGIPTAYVGGCGRIGASNGQLQGIGMETAPNSAPQFTDKELAFIHWYCILLNATEAAKRAGYGDEDTTRESLASMGSALLRKVAIRAEIDRRLKASIPSPDEVLQRVGQRAMVDLTPYLNEKLELDVEKLGNDGLGHLVTGVKRTRDGPELTLTDPQTATKTLARYHRLLGSQLDITLQDKSGPTIDEVQSLRQQLEALQQASDSEVGEEENEAE